MGAFPLGRTAGAAAKAGRLLYYTRSVGFEHSVVRRQGDKLSHSELVLTELARRFGFEVECTKDGSIFDGDLDRFDAIVFYSCGDQTQPSLDKSPPMTLSGKQRLLDVVAAGKGFVGFHAAADTFHSKGLQTDRDPYVAMLGGEFVSHGDQQEASLVIASHFPGVGNLGCAEGLSFTDEWYALTNFAKDLHVILVQETAYMKGQCYHRPNYPCTWARMHGKGRVFYTSLGHREDVWTNPFFQTIALGGLRWAAGAVDADVKPNLARVTPHADPLTNPKR
jgi:type 1 glutamine amidotransferase